MFEISLDFSFPGGLPQFVTPGGGTTVMVDVAANTAAPQPNTGQLLVDSGGGFQSIPMNELAPNSYEAVFPPTPCGESVNYYFAVGTTSGGTITEPSDAPVSTFNTISGTSFVMQFADDAETDPGYSVSGSVTDGEWERGMPISNAVCDRGNPGADGDGSGQCWLTDNSSANSCNSDVDNGTTILTSPVLDASGETFVSYWRWFDNTAGSNPNTDTMTVQISNDGGSSWAHMETIGPVAQASGGWF
ncbi:MAG: hypothetical protein GTN83_07565, partial [Acidobacteria bacterium]|nr:hypothetical protein [Acidobacteriota bacterium]